MANVLGRVRLSRYTDESTSVERQQEIITSWADANGHEVVGWAVDTDVSRSVDPFNAPELGEWFKPHKAQEWDIVACWKLDRLATGSIYLNKVMAWGFENEKTLVSCSEGFDLNTWAGRMLANIIAGLAEGELEAIRERTTDSQRALRNLGRWPGGVTHYGYFPVKTKDGWKLEIDPVSSRVILDVIDQLNASDYVSVQSICDRLTAEGVPTPRDYYRQVRKKLAEDRGEEYFGKEPEGKPWNSQTLFKILTSKTLMGYVTHDGETIRDDAGLPITKAEELVSPDEWNRLQAALEARRLTKTNNRTSKASPLLGVALCLGCGNPFHHRGQTADGKLYRYYYCRSKCSQSINAEDLESMTEETFLERVGHLEILKKVYIPAVDHTAELEREEQALDELAAMVGKAASKTAKERLQAQIEATDARIVKLESMPQREASTELRPTGRTYAQEWETRDSEGRRQLLLQSGIRLRARLTCRGRKANEGGVFEASTYVPEEILERLAELEG